MRRILPFGLSLDGGYRNGAVVSTHYGSACLSWRAEYPGDASADAAYRKALIGHIGRAQVVRCGGLIGLKMPESTGFMPLFRWRGGAATLRRLARFRHFRAL